MILSLTQWAAGSLCQCAFYAPADIAESAIHQAAEKPQDAGLEDLQALYEQGADLNACVGPQKVTPLHCATRANNIAVANFLLHHGANPNLPAYASNNGAIVTPIVYATLLRRREILNLLIKYKANVDAPYGWHTTPLSCAASRGDLNTIEVLLANGANPNFGDLWNTYPLNHAATPAAAQLLLDNGAEINHTDEEGETALDDHNNLGREEVAKFLRKHGALTGYEVRHTREL